MEFKENYFYIDKRESNQTVEIFNKLMYEQTVKDKDGFLKRFDDKLRLELTGNRYLDYVGTIQTIVPVGDYVFNGYAFELKRGFDLYNSVTGEIKRLDKQIDLAKKLLRNGTIKNYQIFCTMENGFTGDLFDEFNYFTSQPGIQVNQYYDIECCFKAMFNTWNTTTRLKEFSPNYLPKWNPAIGVLYLLDSCSENMAKKIYNKFHVFYIDDLEKLSVNKLKEIKGIGDIKAMNLYNELQDILHRPVKNTSSIIWDEGEVFVY